MGKYLILGASSDVGLELIAHLLQSNRPVEIYAQYHTNSQRLDQLAYGDKKVRLIQGDFSSTDSVQVFLAQCKELLDLPTHIVHLPAEKFQYTRFKAFDWNRFMRGWNIQIYSLVEILRHYLPLMGKGDAYSKVVIMLSSCTIGIPPRFISDYVMLKYSLLGLMKSLAVEYDGKKISINALSPSMMETKFLSDIDERIVQINAKNSRFGKNASVKDIVPALEFLLSDASNYMNGVNLNLSNGEV